MESKTFGKKQTRRSFLGTSAVLATGAMLPITSKSYGKSLNVLNQSAVRQSSALNSRYGGVQIGTITYSFRGLTNGLEGTLQAIIDTGLSSVELMGTGVEDYLGAPANTMRRQTRENPYNEEELKMLENYREEVKEWRRVHGTIEKYEALRKKFNDAGINIHIYKWTAGNTDEELDYSFQVAKALGAVGITIEATIENARMLGPAAERNGMYSILHNHGQYADPSVSVDEMLAVSPANMLNFDIGHYYGSTGIHPIEFIKKYRDRIVSLHLKDKTAMNNETQADTNQVWGQGETPLEETLLFVKNEKLPYYCDIELEYQIAPWSDSVKEVATCRKYCRQILI